MTTIANKLTRIASAKEAIKAAIEAKGVEVANAPLAEYAEKIEAIKSGGDTPQPAIKWTGHADAEGLRAIGWTDEDIAYFQEYGVNWNEEDDELYKVTAENKALYGVITASNIQTYAGRIVYMPKIDTTGITNMAGKFSGCKAMIGIPMVDTSAATSVSSLFSNCYALRYIPPINIGNATTMDSMFNACYSLVHVPLLDTAKVTNMNSAFYNCYSLVEVPMLDTAKVANMVSMFNGCINLQNVPLFDTSKVTTMGYTFRDCRALKTIPQLNTSAVTTTNGMLYGCSQLITIPLIDTAKATNISTMFYGCESLVTVPQLDFSSAKSASSIFHRCKSLIDVPPLTLPKATDLENMFYESGVRTVNVTTPAMTKASYMFYGCKQLQTVQKIDVSNCSSSTALFFNCEAMSNCYIKGIKATLDLSYSGAISKESLLYIINNEAATSAITIQLASRTYIVYENDADILAALANHPNVSLAK